MLKYFNASVFDVWHFEFALFIVALFKVYYLMLHFFMLLYLI